MTLNNRKSVWDFVQPGRARNSVRPVVDADTETLTGEWSDINTPLATDEQRAADELLLGMFDAAHQTDGGNNSTEVLRPLFSMHAAQPAAITPAKAGTMRGTGSPTPDAGGSPAVVDAAPLAAPASTRRCKPEAQASGYTAGIAGRMAGAPLSPPESVPLDTDASGVVAGVAAEPVTSAAADMGPVAGVTPDNEHQRKVAKKVKSSPAVYRRGVKAPATQD